VWFTTAIEYRYEDGRFPLSGSCVTILNPDFAIRFPAVKKGLIHDQEAQTSFYLNVFNVRKPLEVSILERSEELRFYKKI
jgi:hypothetical protein